MPTEATGLEHLTPVKIKSTSATERAAFRRCRRRWWLEVVHRLDPQEGNPNFFLGNIYHLALAAYYLALKDGMTVDDAEIAALDAYQDSFDKEYLVVLEQLGFLANFGGPAFREIGELGLEMLQNYLERERGDPLLDEVIAVEFRVNVAIRHPRSGRKVGVLSVQADVVGRKNGELCVVDHKTASRNMPSSHLDLDDQLTAEVFSWWKASDEFPEKAIYNVSLKKAPKPPKRLKDKKGVPQLSRAKNQLTTAALYREAIRDLGLNPGDYLDVLVRLDEEAASGESDLFRREAVFRTPGQMEAFERDLFYEWKDMQAVARDPVKAYPNPTSDNCGGCPVRVICTTIQDNGDVEAVTKAQFIVRDPRR